MKDLAINKTHLILVNAVVEKKGKILVSQRSFEEVHEPGKWTIPGGKVERSKIEEWNVIENTLKKETLEETGIKIHNQVKLITNNTFIRSTGQHVVCLVFLCKWKSGKARPLEDTINIRWISKKELKLIKFAPNVDIYIKKGFENLQTIS